MVAKKSKRGRKATRKTPPPLAKGGFAPEQIIDKIDLRETCNQILYRVRWPNTWEKEANLNGCDALKNFENNIEQNDDDLTVTEAQDDEELWEVHQILQKTITNGKASYLVKWKDTWLWGEQIANRPDLIRDFEDEPEEQPHSSNANNRKLAEKPPNRKRRRLNHKNDEQTVKKTSNRKLKKKQVATFCLPSRSTADNHLQVIIEDDEIDEILEFGTYFDEKMFLFQRLNGEQALLPTKVAHLKYPDAVMTFYEKHIMEIL